MRLSLTPRTGALPALALLAALAACDGGTDVPVPDAVSVTPSQATIQDIGGTVQLSARVTDEAGNLITTADVSWSSSKGGVASVSASGLVTGLATGTTTIEATAGAARGTATVMVATTAFDCLPSDGTPVSLAVGASMVVENPGDFCVTLPAVSGQEYLVGIQSISENGETFTDVLVQSALAPVTAGAPAGAPSAAGARAAVPTRRLTGGGAASLDRLDGPAARRLRAWRRQHALQMERDVALLRSATGAAALRAPSAAPPQAAVGPGTQLGDTVSIRVRRADAQCGLGDFDEVRARLVYRGSKAWWFEDVDNPDGFTQADWQELGQNFDDVVEPTSTRYFGNPRDLDGNGVIVILFTRTLNERGSDDEGITTLGFVNPCDFLPRQTFQASNEGEFFYHIAADPGGAVGDSISVEAARQQAEFVIGHEYTHIIQFSRRIGTPPNQTTNNLMAVFMAEGQATLAEEVIGHATLGNQPGQDYGIDTALRDPGFTWYGNAFVDLFAYFGLDLDEPGRIEDAPELCTWTSVQTPDPCWGRASWYGVTWSLLRWASDQFGPGFPGGEAGLQRALVDNDRSGLANLADVTNRSVSFLLGHWAPMLYVDGRIADPDPLLEMTSWDLYDIYTSTTNQTLKPFLPPAPRSFTTSAWSDEVTVRSPSFEWYTVETNGAAAAIRATTPGRQALPTHMQMFVVRLR